MTFTARTDRPLVRTTGGSVRYALLEFVAPKMERTSDRPPVNLAFVLDRSGSMGGSKIELARQAIRDALARLDDRDRFALIAYDDVVDIVTEATPATAEAKAGALERLARIDARGSTNLSEGWLRGCEQVALGLAADAISRCLLLTDGLANVGIRDPEALRAHAAEIRARGVSTTTFGVGADFDELLLQSMADAGGGHFYYIDSAQKITDIITSEVGEALEVVARNAAIAAHTPEVLVEQLSPLPFERTGEATLVALGDLVSEQSVQVVMKLTFPPGQAGRQHEVTFRLTDRDGVLGGASATLTWSHAPHHEVDAQPRDRSVDRVVATLYAAKAREEAVRLNRAGQFDAARWALKGVAERIGAYAGDDSALQAMAGQLMGEQQLFAAPMAAADLKMRHFASANMSRGRDFEGKANKGR
ncbi:MAG: VWA domain-containing protein [Chloroflexota bacterium]|nr:VWA domain-containing protein [Chloroflexota bacterium]